jgi:hypothetical protein
LAIYSTGESLYCGMLCMQRTCPTKKHYLGIWRADWVFGAPESTMNNVSDSLPLITTTTTNKIYLGFENGLLFHIKMFNVFSYV